MPGFLTPDNPRNSRYPWSKKRQRFINIKKLKSRIILRINLTLHESQDNVGINSERE